jgi:hypothetical protein
MKPEELQTFSAKHLRSPAHPVRQQGLARDVLHDGDGTLADERHGLRMGTDAVACGAGRGSGGAEKKRRGELKMHLTSKEARPVHIGSIRAEFRPGLGRDPGVQFERYLMGGSGQGVFYLGASSDPRALRTFALRLLIWAEEIDNRKWRADSRVRSRRLRNANG